MKELLDRREWKKQRTREALEAAAWRLFQRKGFDETTIEDITDAAGVSPRTFFRYFDSKEAVLFGDWHSDIERAAKTFLSLPADEHPLFILREVMLSLVERFEAERPKYLFRKKLATTSNNVGAYERNVILPTLEALVIPALAQWMGVDPEEDLRPFMYAGIALIALEGAKRIWIAHDGEVSLSQLVKQAFDIALDPIAEIQPEMKGGPFLRD
jgi:AcrR family transcriptional regulator